MTHHILRVSPWFKQRCTRGGGESLPPICFSCLHHGLPNHKVKYSKQIRIFDTTKTHSRMASLRKKTQGPGGLRPQCSCLSPASKFQHWKTLTLNHCSPLESQASKETSDTRWEPAPYVSQSANCLSFLCVIKGRGEKQKRILATHWFVKSVCPGLSHLPFLGFRWSKNWSKKSFHV